jgi:polyadenylate-binding protein
MSSTVAAAASVAPAAAAAGAPKPHPSAALYVGELNNDVTEGILFEIFNQVGPVASIRVCRDTLTRRSLGYAYVNFHSVVDAERALDTLNNTAIKGRPCRIMWSQRDPSVRKSGVGNIFIKNLDTNIGHKELHDTFSAFGNILSCKVALDDKGESRGYGFVHFETAESADNAIQMVNDMMLGSKKVFVGHFRPKKEREQEKETSWTNVYVKDLDLEVSDAQLKEAFGKHGPISSATIMRDDKGASRGFGFVNFEHHEDALKAVDALNGITLGNKKIWAGRAQKKSEREGELRRKFEQLKMDRLTKYQGINLYIKNLEDDVGEERLRKEFGALGEIKSIKIMADEKGVSRGFGFVCFSTPEEAQRAVTEMNGRILTGCTKPLYVALHEPKEMRRHKLAARHAQGRGLQGGPGGKQPRGPNPAGGVPAMYAAGAPPVYYPPGAAGPQGFVYPQQMLPRGGPRQGAWQQPAYAQMPNYLLPALQRGAGAPGPAGQPGVAAPAGAAGANPAAGAAGAQAGRGGPQGGAPRGGAQAARGGRPQGAQGRPGAPQGDLTLQYLAQFPAEQQKMLLGERIYRLIEKTNAPLAGKITGMFLDSGWPVEELLALTTSEEKLNAKITEAVEVLERAGAAQ